MDNKKNKKVVKEEAKNASPFDKFVNDQLAREEKNNQRFKKFAEGGETPQQKYNKLYREKPLNRTVWSKK
jgi:hypothetical protein|tara:strand:+ start:478 stop:687 length:210 start_codon:yes stop_codon:yes gene_type:complete